MNSDCGDDERCVGGSSSKPLCKRIDCASIGPGLVMISEGSDRDCAKSCKTENDCPQVGRPRICQQGAVQQKTRKANSTCFPR